MKETSVSNVSDSVRVIVKEEENSFFSIQVQKNLDAIGNRSHWISMLDLYVDNNEIEIGFDNGEIRSTSGLVSVKIRHSE